MTTLTPVRQHQYAKKSPTLWRSMLRVIWIQHRFSVLVMIGIFGFIAAFMLVTGASIHGDYTKYLSNKCSYFGGNPVNGAECSNLSANLLHSLDLFTIVEIITHVVPVLIAMFIGAPLVSREFESGSYQFAWTQGTPRSSWLTMKLLFLGTMVVVLAIPLGLIASWYAQPFNAIGFVSHWQPGQFGVTAVTLPVICLTGLLSGVLIGALLKKIVSAIATAGLMVGGLVIAIFAYLDRAIFSIHTSASTWYPTDGNIGAVNRFAGVGGGLESGPRGSWGGWLVNIWYEGLNGVHLSVKEGNQVLDRLFSSNPKPTQVESHQYELTWLANHHYSFWISYQPANRFWIAQGVQATIILALGFILYRVAMAVIRRSA
jgi:ABC-type transport system involved in multi-copper enzyme maturation permease subunit